MDRPNRLPELRGLRVRLLLVAVLAVLPPAVALLTNPLGGVPAVVLAALVLALAAGAVLGDGMVLRRVRALVAERRAAEAALDGSRAQLAGVIESAMDAIVTVDDTGRVVLFNVAAQRLFRHAADDALGEPVERFLAGGLPSQVLPRVGDARSPWRSLVGLGADGSLFPLEASISEALVSGVRLRTLILRDITERTRAQAELEEANRKLSDWVDELEQRTREISLLGRMGELLQACRSPTEAWEVLERIGPQLLPAGCGALYLASASARETFDAVATWGREGLRTSFALSDCWALRLGRLHEADAAGAPACAHLEPGDWKRALCMPLSAQGRALGVLHLRYHGGDATRGEEARARRDEARRRLVEAVAEHAALALSNLRLQESLRGQALRDPLTDLFNRRYMEETLEREIARAVRRASPLAVLMLDLDRFKHFNDTYGHRAGDAMLETLGAFLREHVRGEDVPCRYGGEEFTLILPGATSAVALRRAAQLRAGVRELSVNERGRAQRGVSASFGIAVYPEHGTTGDDLLRAADAALYRAKGKGGDCVIVAAKRRGHAAPRRVLEVRQTRERA